MSEPLSHDELSRMRREHRNNGGWCNTCNFVTDDLSAPPCDAVVWPCDAAKLLAHFAPGPVPHLEEVQR